ncbi:MAG: nicotinamide riboside transporter PnuC [Myxococcales bacterium]
MEALFTALNQPLLWKISWSELIGDVAGLACVWLVARKHILNWPIGLLNNAFWFLSFWWAGLYGDASLQGIFAILAVYGWWEWARKDSARQELPIRRTTSVEWAVLAMATAAGTVAVWALLSSKTDSKVPVWDASVVALSLAATYGQAKKLLESWWLWIAVDVVSIPLYLYKDSGADGSGLRRLPGNVLPGPARLEPGSPRPSRISGGRDMKPRHGLVIGKFYPPHAGHHLLVRTAAALCERVSVVVMAASVESIPLEDRVAWMKEVHAPDRNVSVAGVRDDHPIEYEDDAIWRAHVALMLEGARQLTSEPIDAVFTSESYGEELGRRLGAKAISVDPGRALAPISGTLVRKDVPAAWAQLAEPVRGGLAKRVVLVGAESTGKTTLAAELAQALRVRGGAFGTTRWVPEYGWTFTAEFLAQERARAQLEGRLVPELEELAWPSSAFEQIAAEQNRWEDREARLGGPVLVCDTDAFATGVWHERYVGRRAAPVEALARRNALYLLTHPDDVPFAADVLRDGERIRSWMTGLFEQRLRESGRRWAWIRGGRAARLQAALEAVDRLVAEGWKLADPLG